MFSNKGRNTNETRRLDSCSYGELLHVILQYRQLQKEYVVSGEERAIVFPLVCLSMNAKTGGGGHASGATPSRCATGGGGSRRRSKAASAAPRSRNRTPPVPTRGASGRGDGGGRRWGSRTSGSRLLRLRGRLSR
ncbi:unnamed protein product [Musa acuminata var. zebrina]